MISGPLEPAYDIGGDSFDYATTRDTLTCSCSTRWGTACPPRCSPPQWAHTGTRAARGLTCPDRRAGQLVIAGQLDAEKYATAVIARLHIGAGRLRWVNAGHPLASAAIANTSEGSGFVKPSDLASAVAHTASSTPDRTSKPRHGRLLDAVLSLSG